MINYTFCILLRTGGYLLWGAAHAILHTNTATTNNNHNNNHNDN